MTALARTIARDDTPAENENSLTGDFIREAMPHREELFATALRMTKNRADAEDLVQDTLARALKAWARYIPDSNCRAWLLRILTNSFINNYRRRRRHHRFATETGDDAVRALYGADLERCHRPQEECIKGELSDEVKQALAELGDDYRSVIELADLGGARYREVADVLGVPIGTVMSRLYRARRRLEENLADYAARDYGIRRRDAA